MHLVNQRRNQGLRFCARALQTIWAPSCAVATTIDAGRVGGSRSWPVACPFSAPHPTGRSARTFPWWRDAGFQHQEAWTFSGDARGTLQRTRADCNLLPGPPSPPRIRRPGCNVTSCALCLCGSPGRLRDLPANSISAGGMEAAPGPAGWGSIPSSTYSGSRGADPSLPALLPQPRRLLAPSWRRPPRLSAISTPGGDPPPP